MIVSFLSQKGGVGKSTLARNLAAFASSTLGWKVLIADLDPFQGTSMEWHARRLELPLPRPPLDVGRFASAAKLDAASLRYDLVVADGRPLADKATVQTARVSELVVLPSGMSLDDLMPQLRFANELLDAGVPADRIVLAFTRVKASDTERARVREWLADAEVEALGCEIREMPAIRQAQDLGLAACEARPKTVRDEATGAAIELSLMIGEPAL